MHMRALIPALLIALAGAAPALATEPGAFNVTQDQAKIIRIALPASTVIIGNPAIADAILQDSQTLVITGRSAGTTNIIVLDSAGEPIEEQLVAVDGPAENGISLYRGNQRFSYNCAPLCQASIVPGDEPAYYKALSEQNALRNSSALGMSQAQPKTTE